jgi:hypothetical protein
MVDILNREAAQKTIFSKQINELRNKIRVNPIICIANDL